MTNSYWILGLKAVSSEAVFWTGRESGMLYLRKKQQCYLPPEHTLALRRAWGLGFVWSKEGLGEGYHVEERGVFAFFSSDSGTTNATGEHLLSSTKVAFNLNAQGLHLSVAQFINWSRTAAFYYWHDPSVMGETKTLLKGLFLQEIAELSPCCLHLNPSRWGIWTTQSSPHTYPSAMRLFIS